MEAYRLQYSLNSEHFQAQETMPHSADLRVHFTSFWKLLLLYISLLLIIVNGTIPNYELRKRAVACCWLTGKKKKKRLPFPVLYPWSLLSCTELVVQWGVGHRKAFVLPLLCSNNSFVELDCDKSWHLHCPGLGIITTHSIRSKSRLACIVFSTAISVMFTVL